ncbi:MAG: HepT-like ribonuclease domain-containing protein [Limnothrix sp.]
MADRDTLVLLDILISARLAINYVSEMTWTEFLGNIVVQDAVIRRLEIMGIASRNLPPELHKTLPQLPWFELDQIARTISEEYALVNIAFVWDLVHNDLPQWSRVLEFVLPDRSMMPNLNLGD